MDFERREYEYVRKIAETGSFLAAADKLYITQPSLSQFIRRIERHIGAELFDRSHQPVTLTEAGRIYLDIEGQIQELCKVREQRIQDLGQTIGGTVRIGSSNYRSSTILAKAIPVINNAIRISISAWKKGRRGNWKISPSKGRRIFPSSSGRPAIRIWNMLSFSRKNCSWPSHRPGTWNGNRCMIRSATPATRSLIIIALTAILSWS